MVVVPCSDERPVVAGVDDGGGWTREMRGGELDGERSCTKFPSASHFESAKANCNWATL